jgi:hypothetical protein
MSNPEPRSNRDPPEYEVLGGMREEWFPTRHSHQGRRIVLTYLQQNARHRSTAEAYAVPGKYVRASGTVYERKGTHAIMIDEIKQLKDVHLTIEDQ